MIIPNVDNFEDLSEYFGMSANELKYMLGPDWEGDVLHEEDIQEIGRIMGHDEMDILDMEEYEQLLEDSHFDEESFDILDYYEDV